MEKSDNVHVERLELAMELERRVALATVRIGEVVIRGVAVWRSSSGRLRVYLPSYRLGAAWDDIVQLPADLRADVEAAVITAFKEAKSHAEKPAETA